MNPDPVDPTLRCANRQPVKLNYTQRIGFKNVAVSYQHGYFWLKLKY